MTEAAVALAPRVAVDARMLQDPPLGGVGRILANVLPLVADHLDLSLLLDARRGPVQLDRGRQYKLRGKLTGRGVEWLQVAAPAWLNHFDGVFHCPFYGLPYWQPVPAVVTIHDISFETHPELFSHGKRAVFRAQARHAARTARCVITDSDFVRSEIIDHYRLDSTRIVVARNPADPAFRPSDREEREPVLSALEIRGRYIIAMGGAARRGLEISLGAWRALRRKGLEVSLVVVGDGNFVPEPGLAAAGRVDDAELSLLLGGAEAFCYPTATEGLGLPALEAIATGTPVVCARVGALPEVLGAAAVWVAERSPEAFESALVGLLEDPAAASEHRRISLERARQGPTWEQAAEAHLRAYRMAAEVS